MSTPPGPAPRPRRGSKPRKPPLYRVKRILLIAAIIATVLIVIYLVIASLSFVQFIAGMTEKNSSCSNSNNSKSDSSNSNNGNDCSGLSGSSSMYLAPGNTVVFQNNLSLSNDGFFTVNNFQLREVLTMPSGEVLDRTSSPAVSIPAGTSQTISPSPPLSFSFSQPAAAKLLTKDTNLSLIFGINASYANLFTFSIQVPSNYSWGAPFADYVTTVSPMNSSGGSPNVKVTVSFQNDASFPIAGTLTINLLSPSDQQCGSTTLSVGPLENGQGGQSSFNQTTGPVTLASGCNPHGGGEVEASFASPDLNVNLPSQGVP